jgi:AraC-like DNA-binding protein
MASGARGSLEVERRFGVRNPPTLVCGAVSAGTFSISRLRIPVARHPLGKIPPQPVYSVHVNFDPYQYTVFGRHRIAGAHDIAPKCTVIQDFESPPSIVMETPASSVRFHVPQAALSEIGEEVGGRVGGLLRAAPDGVKDPLLLKMAYCLLPMLDSGETVDSMLVDEISLAFMTHLLRTYGTDHVARSLLIGGLAPWQEKRAKEALAASRDSGISIADVAKLCGLSVAYFTRAFKQTTGRPPHRWVIEQRCEEAKRLLALSDLTLQQIALKCGFSNQPHFTRTFTRLEGDSPKSWRRLRRL